MDELAADVNGERWDCSILFKVMPLAPVRYAIMAIRTLEKLFKEKPHVVIAQNPPIFLPLLCWFYCLFSRCMLIVDHHCIWSVKTIRYPILKNLILLIEKFVARQAKLNVSPHDIWTGMLKGFGDVRALTIIDYVETVKVRKISRESLCGTKHLVVYPCGSGAKERPDLAIEAVQQLGDITLLITGQKRYLKRFLLLESDRIVFSGFLPKEDYFGVLMASDFVMNLTDEPYTIPHFIYEALALGKPVLSSPDDAVIKTFDWSLCVIKGNDVEDVKMGIRNMFGNLDLWAEKACSLHKKLKVKRKMQVEKLKHEIGRQGQKL